jgi:hypothetical protein
MLLITAIPLTCWLCALVAMLGKPHFGDEVPDLVYSRLLDSPSRAHRQLR